MCACVGPDHLAIHHWLVVWSLLIQNLTASFVCWLVWHCVPLRWLRCGSCNTDAETEAAHAGPNRSKYKHKPENECH